MSNYSDDDRGCSCDTASGSENRRCDYCRSSSTSSTTSHKENIEVMHNSSIIKKIEIPKVLKNRDEFVKYHLSWDEWELFLKQIKELNKAIDESVEVLRSETHDSYWRTDMPELNRSACKYKALLIGIEPTKQETAEDVLKDLMMDMDESRHQFPKYKAFDDWIKRAKKVLEQRND